MFKEPMLPLDALEAQQSADWLRGHNERKEFYAARKARRIAAESQGLRPTDDGLIQDT